MKPDKFNIKYVAVLLGCVTYSAHAGGFGPFEDASYLPVVEWYAGWAFCFYLVLETFGVLSGVLGSWGVSSNVDAAIENAVEDEDVDEDRVRETVNNTNMRLGWRYIATDALPMVFVAYLLFVAGWPVAAAFTAANRAGVVLIARNVSNWSA